MTKKILLSILAFTSLVLLRARVTSESTSSLTSDPSSSSDNDWSLPSWMTNPDPTTPVVQPTTTPNPPVTITNPQTITSHFEQTPGDFDTVITTLSSTNPPVLPTSSNPGAQAYYQKLGQAFQMLEEIINNTKECPDLNTQEVASYMHNELLQLLTLAPTPSTSS